MSTSDVAQQVAPRRTLLLIAMLYVSQGIPMGLAFIAMPAILRSQGASLQDIGLLGMILIPWAAKFLWAPFIDRTRGGWLGPRRSWIFPAQFALVAIYIVIALLPETQTSLRLLFALLILANFVSATQDIATDGFAVEALQKLDFGWANGIQIGGFSLGMIAGGAVTVFAYEHSGWTSSFLALAGTMALTLVAIVLTPEHTHDGQSVRAKATPSLLNVLRRKDAWAMLTIAGAFYFCTTMASSMKGALLIDKGLTISQVGLIGGTGAATIAIFGAALGSLFVQRFGARAVAVYGGAASALLLSLWLVPAMSATTSFTTAIAITVVAGIASGIAYVAFFTVFMKWASLDQAGTDFTVLQCTESITNIGASILAGQIAGAFGYTTLFVLAPILGIAIVIIIAMLLGRLNDAADLEIKTAPSHLS